MRRATYCIAALWALVIVTSAGETAAQEQSGEDLWKQIQALPWVTGPQNVSAVGTASLALPEHYVFLDTDATPKFMNLTENPRSGDEREQLFGPEDLHWFALIEFTDDGYVQDKEEIDSAALLEQMKSSTESANAERRKNGWAEMKITGWRVEPHYDPTTNRLEWAVDADNSDGSHSTNFNTRILGRRGVTSAVLVTDPEHFAADLGEFRTALAGYEFNAGERYSEFQSGDKIAAYGLGALVLGGAAAVATKSGFLKYLLYLVVAGGAAVAGFFKKIFNRRKAS